MCGIYGSTIIYSQNQVEEKLKRIDFRGPDKLDWNYLGENKNIIFGHNRLAIIDLDTRSNQPFSYQHVHIVFNGEIYNFVELAAQLKAKGYIFRTHCDTEVILYAWQEWGEGCVNHFRGMFAFALYDRKAQSLFLARDRLGIKPLFYALLPNQQLLFGSELKVLKQHPAMSRALEPRAVEDYFALGYIPEPKTIYKHVYKPQDQPLLLQKQKQFRVLRDQFNAFAKSIFNQEFKDL